MNKTLKLALVAGTVLFAVPSYSMLRNLKNFRSLKTLMFKNYANIFSSKKTFSQNPSNNKTNYIKNIDKADSGAKIKDSKKEAKACNSDHQVTFEEYCQGIEKRLKKILRQYNSKHNA